MTRLLVLFALLLSSCRWVTEEEEAFCENLCIQSGGVHDDTNWTWSMVYCTCRYYRFDDKKPVPMQPAGEVK